MTNLETCTPQHNFVDLWDMVTDDAEMEKRQAFIRFYDGMVLDHLGCAVIDAKNLIFGHFAIEITGRRSLKRCDQKLAA